MRRKGRGKEESGHEEGLVWGEMTLTLPGVQMNEIALVKRIIHHLGYSAGSILSVESNQNVESKTKNVESKTEKNNVESKIAVLLQEISY